MQILSPAGGRLVATVPKRVRPWPGGRMVATFLVVGALAGLRAAHGAASGTGAQPSEGTTAVARVANWREDLRFLTQCIRDIHPRPFWQTSPADFDSLVNRLDRRIPDLDDAQIAVELMRVAALLRDGHSGVDTSPLLGSDRLYPVRVYPFQDGVYVMSVATEYAEYIGARVERIGPLSVQEALDQVMQVLNGENEYTRLNFAPLLLMQPRLLRVLGISTTEDQVRFEVVTRKGKRKSFWAQAVTVPAGHGWYSAGEGLPVTGYRTGREDSPGPPALCWRGRDKSYWFEYLPEQRLLWMQFNAVQNADDESLAQFCARMFDFADRHDIDKFVIDLRWNGGGNLELLNPLLHGLICRASTLGRFGHFFAVIGRGTYSAAHVCAVQLEAHTQVLFVGEPSGATPNHFGDVTRMRLPHSGLPVLISKWAWQPALPWDLRPWIAPQLPAPFTSDDYRSNRDPALNAILKCDHPEPPLGQFVRAKMEGDLMAGAAAYREWKLRNPDIYGWTTEGEMNNLAYQYLQDQEPNKAIAVLQLNLETYPRSAQTLEILGEAYQASGETAKAVDHYRRALAIDPQSRAANEMMRRIARDEPPSAWR
jgi:hypothetical protein